MGPLVHSALTDRWARQVGLTEYEAATVAAACIAVDIETPARAGFRAMTRHFGPWAWYWVWRNMREATRTGSLDALGRALHAAQDAHTHGVIGLAHLRFNAGLGRDPDDWNAAPLAVQARIERSTLRLLVNFRRRRSRLPGR